MVNQKSDKDFCPEREQRVEGPLLLSDEACLSRVRRGGEVEGPLPTSSRVRMGELRVEWRLFLKSKRRLR